MANNNVATGPSLVQQPIIVKKIFLESSSSSSGFHSSMPVSILNKTQVIAPKPTKVQCYTLVIKNPNPEIASQTDGSYVLECKITSVFRSKLFLSVTKLKDLLDYLMLCLLGARDNEMRPSMETSMVAVLSHIVDGTPIIEAGREEESVGVEESDLKDISDELVKWCKMMLDRKKPRIKAGRRSRAKLKCTICDKEITMYYLETHMKSHSSEEKHHKPYSCPICQKQFRTLPVMKKHKNIHDTERKRDHKCQHCDYAAYSKTNLEIHMVTHEGHQKLPCSICGKHFRNKFTLNEHERRHTEDKSLVCDICGKTYINVTCLNLHRRRVHEGFRKKYTCGVCDEAFTSSNTFRTHKLRHEDYRPYKCDLCDKAFFHRKVLNSHRLIHTGEKPYTCVVCGRSFRQKAALTTHSYTHGAIRPHQCEKCSRQFIHRVDLKRHVCPFANESKKDDKFIKNNLNKTEKVG